jgi:hypothetical protein
VGKPAGKIVEGRRGEPIGRIGTRLGKTTGVAEPTAAGGVVLAGSVVVVVVVVVLRPFSVVED